MTADGPQFPYDLEADASTFVLLRGTSDPDDLAYGGLLNLVGRRTAGISCNLHPAHVIGPNGCPRCREILRVRRMLTALDGVLDLVDAYERLVAALRQDLRREVVDAHAREVAALRGQIEIVVDPCGPGESASAQWGRPF